MQTIAVNLYEHFDMKPAGAGGMMRVWKMETSSEVSPGRLRPAVLILPGGGYARTSAREAEQVALRFAASGYVPFVLDYSCAPSVFPVALREAALAMRYIRENASAFEVNPQMVAALGFSAGGHLCGTLGTLFDCDEVLDIGSARLLRPDALVLCYPVAVSWDPPTREPLKTFPAAMKSCGSGFPWKNVSGGICPRCFSGIPGMTPPFRFGTV